MSMPELKQHNNGVWYIHWSEGRRSKRASTSEKDENRAKIFLANWLLATHAEPTRMASTLVVRDLWALYVEKHRVVGERTRELSWKNLEPHFGALTVPEVTDDTVEDYAEKRAEGEIGRPSVPATIRRELVALRACLNWCAQPKRRIIAKADLPVFDLPPEGDARDRWLRYEEIQRLMDAATAMRRGGKRLSRAERFLWLAMETAARKTAICELTWDRVDFETRVIDYNVPGRVRTKKRRTQVPISNALLPILRRAYAERKGDLVMDNKAEVLDIIKRVAERAGVDDVSPHVLRHTAATHMARRGVPLWKIAGILGNSMQMVEKVYAKHCPDGLVDAVNMISGGILEQAE